MADERVSEEKKDRPIKPEKKGRAQSHADGSGAEGRLSQLQKTVGNRALQRLLAQRKAESSHEVDDETAGRINQERSSGQALDEGAQESLGNAMGYDFSDVQVHTTPEAASLNAQLSAKAFTTGKDIFFSEGAYNPQSSEGKELLAHELTHVVQQGSGAVGGANRMTVNAPGDAFEQQADAVAHSALSSQPASGAGVQRQANPEEEEEKIQTQAKHEGIQRVEQEDQEEKLLLQEDDEAKFQRKAIEAGIQRVEQEDQEEKILMKPDEEKAVQRQELPEEKKEEEEET